MVCATSWVAVLTMFGGMRLVLSRFCCAVCRHTKTIILVSVTSGRRNIVIVTMVVQASVGPETKDRKDSSHVSG